MLSRTDPQIRDGGGVVAAVGLVLTTAYLSTFAWALTYRAFDVWGGMMVAPVLVLATLPLIGRDAATRTDPRLRNILVLALMVKLAAAIVRYGVAFEVYGGAADAADYMNQGQRLAESYSNWVFTGLDLGAGGSGTRALRVITGLVFSVTGPTAIGGFLVFSWMGFWGLYFFYRAFRLGVPEGDHERYALLVFFVPSLLFWPSSVGKEAWMMLTLGVATYGVARVLARRTGGYLVLALGLGGATLVRPHLTVLVAAAIAAAYLLRRAPAVSALAPVAKVAGVVVIGALLLVTLQQTEEFFGVDNQGTSGLTDVLDETSRRSSQGGSEFDAPSARSPAQIPSAIVAVLFRPFPFEAHNTQARIASLEGLALLALFAWSWPRLRGIPRLLRDRPYVAFALVYAVLFCVAFSSIGNFGILTRQRVQVIPLALVLLALPETPSRLPTRLVRVRN